MPEKNDLQTQLQDAHTKFIRWTAPERDDLYRFCRYLTRTPWDAEDLVQEVLTRCFATMGMCTRVPESPRAYLFRTASHLWLKQRSTPEVQGVSEPQLADDPLSGPELVELIAALQRSLTPQEQLAVLFKDVFALNLVEIAGYLQTTEGAVKSALSRGRSKLRSKALQPIPVSDTGLDRKVIERFLVHFNNQDIPALTALLQPNASASVVGMVKEHNRDAIVSGSLPHTFDDGYAIVTEYLSEPIVVIGPRKDNEERITGLVTVIRMQTSENLLAGMQYYYFTPQVLKEVANAMGIPSLVNQYLYDR